MGTITRFDNIEAWQLAQELSKKIWVLTLTGTFKSDFALKDQINRAAGSVMDNIAEGFGRGGNREFIQFLGYARGSINEVQSQLYRAFDRSHMSEKEFKSLKFESEKVGTKISNLLSYLKQSDYRGQKFK